MHHAQTARRALLVTAALAALAALPDARAAAADVDPHAHHALPAEAAVRRSSHAYRVPAVELLRQDGARVTLAHELDDGRFVVVNFIYTTCTTICPMSSQVFAQLQAALGPARARVHLVSISIDPEQDTPPRLREYAARFGAGAGWTHYTGTTAASVAVQRAFDVYRGDKMNHAPVTLLRPAPGRAWIRLDGFASATELASEIRGSERGR